MTKVEKPKSLLRRIIGRWVFYSSLLFFVLLCACLLSRYFNPVSFWPGGILGLLFPFIYLIHVFYFLYFGVRLKKQIILSMLGLIIGANTALNYFQLNEPDNTVEDPLSVMSYNVRVFDYYDWKGNKDGRNRILDLMRGENCDIYCMQEIYFDSKGDFLSEDSLKRTVKSRNAHIEITKTLNQKKHFGYWGIGTFSKYPIVGKGKVDFPRKGNNVCIYTDLRIGPDTIRVYNMHLQSIHFGKEDYKFLQDLKADKETEEIESSKKILRRLKRAFQRRGPQVDLIKASINASPYPVIVCGDFNDPPASYTYQQLAKGLKDAFREKGNGFGKTYNGIFPSLRIDYILFSESMRCAEFETLPEEHSDHHAVRAVISR